MAGVSMFAFIVTAAAPGVPRHYEVFLSVIALWFIILAGYAFHGLWEMIRKTIQRLARMAVIDETSGSFDSLYLQLRLEEEEDRAKRYGGVTSLLCIDVGGLEETVERHGQEGADAVLESLVATMLDELRRCDVLGRLAENEFLAILPETDRRNARLVAERERASVSELSFDCPDGGKVDSIRLNIGIAALPINGETMNSVIAAARNAASQVKSSGADEVGVSEQFVKTDEIGQYIIEEVRGEKRDGG
jgi:diguanylate cyclase (GGDEF)-like protein